MSGRVPECGVTAESSRIIWSVSRLVGWLADWFGWLVGRMRKLVAMKIAEYTMWICWVCVCVCVLSFQLFCIGTNSTTKWYMLTVWGRHAIANSKQPTTGKNYTRLLHFFRFSSCFLSLGTIFLWNTKGKHTHTKRLQSFTHPHFCSQPPPLPYSDSDETKRNILKSVNVWILAQLSAAPCHTMLFVCVCVCLLFGWEEIQF